jgi:hypothetical protein
VGLFRRVIVFVVAARILVENGIWSELRSKIWMGLRL